MTDTTSSLIGRIKHQAEMGIKYPGEADIRCNEILTLINQHEDANAPRNMLGFKIPQTLDDLKRLTRKIGEKP